MVFIVLLCCVLIQRFVNTQYVCYHASWFSSYYAWFSARLQASTLWQGWSATLILLIPVLFIAAIVIAIIKSLLPTIFYYLLSFAVLWFCMNSRRLTMTESEGQSLQCIIMLRMRLLFVAIFWYGVFGLLGLVLYTAVTCLVNSVAAEQCEEKGKSIAMSLAHVQAVFDWLPLRLAALSCALVGQFSRIFPLWYKQLWTGLSNNVPLVVSCSLLALGVSPEAEQQPITQEQVHQLSSLFDRALIVWMVIIAVFTLGGWLG